MPKSNLRLIEAPDYTGPDRRAPAPILPYAATIKNSEARLPPISTLGQHLVSTAVNCLEPKEAAVLSLHLNHALRAASISGSRAAAESGGIEKGDHVKLERVSSVSAKYEGVVGIVQKTKALRAYVKVSGIARPFYVYLAELVKITSTQYKKASGEAPKAAASTKKPSTSKKTTARKTTTKKASSSSKKKSGAKTPAKKEEPEAAAPATAA